MRVVVVPHDPRWAEMFRDEAATVAEVLGPNACACHHIGSTAIPGIHAKPIIDMLIEAYMAGKDAFIKAMERTALALRHEQRTSCTRPTTDSTHAHGTRPLYARH